MNVCGLGWMVFDTLEFNANPRHFLQMTGNRKPHQDQDAFFKALGRRIKELRKERGWSLSYMHIRHGFVPSQWQRFETGKSVTISSLLKMAEIFEISLGRLIDSLGEFPRKDPGEAVVEPSKPKSEERTMSVAASKRLKAKRTNS